MKWLSTPVSLQTQSYGAWGSHLSANVSSSEVILKIPAFQMFYESTFTLCGSVLLVQRLAEEELFLSEVGIYPRHLSTLIVV